jgi:hypothetical protein
LDDFDDEDDGIGVMRNLIGADVCDVVTTESSHCGTTGNRTLVIRGCNNGVSLHTRMAEDDIM